MTLEKNEKIRCNVAVQWQNMYFSLALDRKSPEGHCRWAVKSLLCFTG